MSEPFLRLLAKGSKNPDSPSEHETLPGHLSDVLGVIRVLASKEGINALKALAITSVGYEELYSILVRAALLHDLGKANSAFQAMVRRHLGGRSLSATKSSAPGSCIVMRHFGRGFSIAAQTTSAFFRWLQCLGII
jgi:hypothetical protein